MSFELTPHDNETEKHALTVAREAVNAARAGIARSINSAMVEAYWTIGKEITVTVGDRAEYGRHLIAYLSRSLTAEYGRGFSERTLREARQFYRTFPIWRTVCAKLSWSHYRYIMREDDAQARDFYVRECAASNWSLRELKRQMDTRLYDRLLHTQEAKALDSMAGADCAAGALAAMGGMKDAKEQAAANVFKDPLVFEFLDIPPDRHVLETELESMLIGSLEDFLLEFGRGFAFVKRQRRLSDNGEDWWVDLVFYNYYLRRFVLLDLKTGKLKSQDAGQMEFYLNFFDSQYRLHGDEPSIGILLCAYKDEVVAKYSAISRNENLYSAQYFTYLPTEEELAKVLKRNRAEFEERLARELQQARDEQNGDERLQSKLDESDK